MKTEIANNSNEIRVKLNITKSNSADVKNLWMSLNYQQKPTVAHIIDHVKKNYLSLSGDIDLLKLLEKKQTQDLIKLYLDEFWLPPYENSKLLRENDCIKVDIQCGEMSKLEQEKLAAKESALNFNKSQLKKRNNEEQVTASDKLSNKQPIDAYNYYYNYYGSYPEYEQAATTAAVTNTQNQNMSDYYNSYNSYKEKEVKKSKLNDKPVANVVVEKNTKPVEKSNKNNKQEKQAVGCYKKFSIGSYAHLLNEEVQQPETDSISGEQIIDKYYDTLKNNNSKSNVKNNKNSNVNKQQETKLTSGDVDKISANINSSGKAKWKNSTAEPKQTQPKHIRFSSSSGSSSSSSSSSESGSEDEVEIKPVKMDKNQSKKEKANNSNQQQNYSKYYEPTKEDQLNAVSNNRSYYIQTAKDLTEFKKVFNQSKLNAPKNELPKSQSNSNLNVKESNKSKQCNSHPASAEKKKPEKQQRKKSQSPPPSPKKIDYNKFESLIGAPRVNDKLAFQILEISESFTPEISDYKTGNVLDFDSASNEVTIKLNSKYNAVLEKPSKFSVVEDENEMDALKSYEKEFLSGQNKENEEELDRKSVV